MIASETITLMGENSMRLISLWQQKLPLKLISGVLYSKVWGVTSRTGELLPNSEEEWLMIVASWDAIEELSTVISTSAFIFSKIPDWGKKRVR